MGKSRKNRCGRKKFGVRSEPRGSLGRGKDTARLASPDDIFHISPRFLPFSPHCRAWSQATLSGSSSLQALFNNCFNSHAWIFLTEAEFSFPPLDYWCLLLQD